MNESPSATEPATEPAKVRQHGTALITGAAKRLGAATAKHLHRAGWNLVIHYHQSRQEAEALADSLNELRPDSATTVSANLNRNDDIKALAENALTFKGEITVLVNNASGFYPTPLDSARHDHWEDLFASNAKAPYFLCQALAESLRQRQGCIINMVDIHAWRPLPDHSIYSMAKSSLVTLTRALARELAPQVRVNGVAPGAILWPENIQEDEKQKILTEIPLERLGKPEDIAATIGFLISADYITGQIIAVDGGRSL
ncbi:MAG: pteridine reductase [Ketobacteraceae bacterium]|nr:pteridine reductase [Ketobacteraceae bacterium]